MEFLNVLSFLVFFLIIASFYSLTCLGLNMQWGFTGLFNVGVASIRGPSAEDREHLGLG